MQRSTRSTFSVTNLALATVALALVGLTSHIGAQARPQAPATPPATPPPAAGTPTKPLVPVAASTVAANPDAYVGEFVTLTGAVEANVSKTSFSVDQDKTKATGKDVLVVAPYLQSAAEANTYVTAIGQLIKFDEAEIAKVLKEYQLDLSPADIAKYKGKPVVLATSVINTAGVDIGKKPIPPPTTDDLALAKIMTRLPPAQAALRKAIEGSAVDLAKEQGTILKAAFTETEAFWKTKGNTEAMGWAAEGKKHADTILTALAANNWADVKAAATPLGATCATCHGKYRVRMDDGTFRIKTGG
jgi:cytochrome c553